MSSPTRALGRNGPQVSAIGFGGMSLGPTYDGKPLTDVEEKLAVLDHAHSIGSRHWDTADVYMDSEDRMGDWFARTGRRDDIFLATKFGCVAGPPPEYTVTIDSSPAYVRRACESSLARLQVDTIDLFYCHRVDHVTPIEKTIEAMVELKNEGKIRYLGLSEVTANTIRRAHAVHPITAYQAEFSPFCLDIEQNGVLDTCRELGIALVAYSPMGRGLLTGQIKSLDDLGKNDFRFQTAKYSKENFPKILELVDSFKKVADTHGCTTSQACLAWVLAQGDDIVPLAGTRTIKYLDQNHEAARIELTKDEIDELRKAAERTILPGDRYPPNWVEFLDKDSVPL